MEENGPEKAEREACPYRDGRICRFKVGYISGSSGECLFTDGSEELCNIKLLEDEKLKREKGKILV